MAEDFRRSYSETSPSLHPEGSTSFLLFTDESQGQAISERDLSPSKDFEKCTSDQSSEGSRSCKTPEEGNIPASVKELLTLLVNRATQNQSEEPLDKGDYQSTGGNSKPILQDESWTSSMATPPKHNSTAVEANDSTLVNFKFEISELDAPEGKQKDDTTHSVSVDQLTEVVRPQNSCKTGDPNSTFVSLGNDSFFGHELISDCESKPVDDLTKNIKHLSGIECPDNSFLEDAINLSVTDVPADIESSFLMSTPLKERSNLKINFNLRKHSFASVSLPLENDNDEECEDESVLEENVVGNISLKTNQDMNGLPQSNIIEGNIDISFSNSQSLLQKITPQVDSSPKTQEITGKINTADFLNVSDELGTANANEVNANVRSAIAFDSYTDKIIEKAKNVVPDDTICDTIPVTKSMIQDTGVSENNMSNLTDEMATVIICSSNNNVERHSFESSMVAEEINAKAIERSTVDDASNIIPMSNMQTLLAVDGNDPKISCHQKQECTSKSDAVNLLDSSRSIFLETSAKGTLTAHDTVENAAPVLIDDTKFNHRQHSDDSLFCSSESVITVITCAGKSPICDNSETSIPRAEEGITLIEGNKYFSQKESNCDQVLCSTDLMQTVPVNNSSTTTNLVKDLTNDLKTSSERERISSEKNEPDITNHCSVNNDEVSGKLPSKNVEKSEIKNIDVLNSIGCLRGLEDRKEHAVIDNNDEEEKHHSVLDSNENQLKVDKKDLNALSCSSVVLSGVGSEIDKNEKSQFIGEEPTCENEISFNISVKSQVLSSQKAEVEDIFTSFETCITTELDAECGKSNALDTVLVDKSNISPCMPVSIMPENISSQKGIDDVNITKGESIPEIGKVSENEGNSHSSNLCEEKIVEKEIIAFNTSNKHSSQTGKNEINTKEIKIELKPKSSDEDFIANELNNSIMENLFSETMDFECDKILVKTKNGASQNHFGNSGDIFCESKDDCVDSKLGDGVNGQHIKAETQDVFTSPTQDFLPSSVLEEVCQATEALVYHGKDSNGNHFDHGMENELLNDDFDNLEANELEILERKADNDEKMRTGLSNSLNSSMNHDPLSGTTVAKKEIINKEELIAKEEKSKKNLRRKILFTASEYMTPHEEIELEITADDNIELVKLENESIKTPNDSCILKMNQTLPCTEKEKPAVDKVSEIPLVRSSSSKTFVYPKKGKKVIHQKVKFEDLMASAVALEKCSTFLPKAQSSKIRLLKNESLVCFSSLEENLNKFTNQSADSGSLDINSMDCSDQLEQIKRQISNAEEEQNVKHLNKDNKGMKFLPPNLKNEEIFLKPEEPSSNLNEILIETNNLMKNNINIITDITSNIGENNTIDNNEDSRKTLPTSVLYKSDQDNEICNQGTKQIDQCRVEKESRDESCTSPVLKRRASSRRNFRKVGKVLQITSSKSDSNLNELEGEPVSSSEIDIIPSKNDVVPALVEKGVSQSLTNNSSSVTDCDNGSNNNTLSNMDGDEDLFYEGDSLFISSNLDFAIASELKIAQAVNSNMCSDNLGAKETIDLKKGDHLHDKVTEDCSNSVTSGIASCKLTEVKPVTTAEQVSPKEPIRSSGNSSEELSHKVENNKSNSKNSFDLCNTTNRKISASDEFIRKADNIFWEETSDKLSEQHTNIEKENYLTSSEQGVIHNREDIIANTDKYFDKNKILMSKDDGIKAQNLQSKVIAIDRKHISSNILDNENITPTRRTLGCGFSTGSGKKVTVSKKALLHAQKLYSEVSEGDGNNLTATSAAATNENVTPLRSTDRFGFSTGSGERVTVSEKALKNAQKLYSEISAGDGINVSSAATTSENVTPLRSTDGFGFSTGSGKRVTVSEKALKNAQKLYSEISASDGNDISSAATASENFTPLRGTDCFGFSTGSGKRVAVSEKALKQAQKLYSEVSAGDGNDISSAAATNENVTPLRRTDRFGFSTGSGKRVTVSEKALKQAQKLYSEVSAGDGNEISHATTTNENVTPLRSTDSFGFSTGSGKRVTVSEKALKQAQKLYSEVSAGDGNEISHATTTYENVTPIRSADGFGFSTGSGKRVTVSEKALKQAQKLYSEVSAGDSNEISHATTTYENVTPLRSTDSFGFSTGSGKRVTVSEKALKQAQKLYSEVSAGDRNDISHATTISENVTPLRSTDGFGFSTGSGKRVTVSEKALKHAQKLYSEISAGDSNEISHATTSYENVTPLRGADGFGFSTGSGKRVTVSERALKNAQKLYSEVSEGDGIHVSSAAATSENITPLRSTDSFGFSTGSGKRVTVSEKALKHAQKIFSEVKDSIGIVSENEASSNPYFGNNVLSISSGSEKRFASPAKSLSLQKRVCLESIAPSSGFSSGIRREFSVLKEANNFPQKFAEDESKLIKESNYLKPSEKHKEEVQCNAHVKLEQVSSGSHMEQNDLAKSPVFKKNISRRSLSMPRKLFSEDSLTIKSDKTSKETALAEKFLDSPHVIRKMECVEVDGSTPLSMKHMIRSKDKLHRNLVRPGEVNQIQQFERVKNCARSEGEYDSKNVSLTSKGSIEKKRVMNETLSTHFAESQGDNYIKAVDLALLNSPAVIENPPSPVLKRSSQRRKRFKAVPSSQMKEKVSVSITPDVFVPPSNDSISSNPQFQKSMQSISVTSQSDEKNLREKELDLWGTDLAEESWLGKQLDLAEASNQMDESSSKTDIWNVARKRQAELILSKKKIQPVIGKHLQERRSKESSLKRSLRELVMGKRPGHFSKEELRKFHVKESTLQVTAKTAAGFQFSLKDFYREGIKACGVTIEDGIVLVPNPDGKFGAEEAKSALLATPGVDPSLLPPGGWCENHFRWIIWKLACTERSFPAELGGRYLTPKNLMLQLKYRWDREIDRGERPALRKILEMDDTASKRIILCISSIEKPENIQSSKKLELDLISSSIKLELTDGWYAIRGVIDAEMAALIKKGKLSIGSKIVTSGAELVNGPSNGCHPLEPPAAKAALRLHTNSTRRARWDVKMGFDCKNPGPLPVSLKSLLPGGGAVSALRRVLLARVYPILNVEKTCDGRKVVRSQKAESRVAAKYERQRQMWLEKIYSEVSAEIQKEAEEDAILRRKGKRARNEQSLSKQNSKRQKRNNAENDKGSIAELSSAEDLLRLLEESEDSSSVQCQLTITQLEMVMEYKQKERERQQRELEERVRQRIKLEEEKASSTEKNNSSVPKAVFSGGNIKRDVVTVLKARLIDADKPVLSKSAVLTVWRPSEEVLSLLSKEGVILNIYNLLSNGMRSSFLQLSSTRQTRYKAKNNMAGQMNWAPYLSRVILSRAFDDYVSQKVTKHESGSDYFPPFGEIDLVAIVVKIGDEPEKERGSGYQHVFVAGSDSSLMSVAFWGGIKEFAVDDIIVPGAIIVATNLQWRRHHGLGRLPTVHAVETSTFSQHPGEERLKNALEKFESELKDEIQLVTNNTSCKSSFLTYCEERLSVMIEGRGRKADISPNASATSSTCIKSDLSVNSAVDKLIPIRPSVAARMKKLQMYEGAHEISLPVCHVKASPSVMRTFQPPARCAPPKSDKKACEFDPSDSNSPPLSLDSDL